MTRASSEASRRAGQAAVDAYFDALEAPAREALKPVRQLVQGLVPEGEERISYGMPAMFCGGVVVYYAAFKKHIGLFPPVSDPEVRARVAAYAGPKGNLQFPRSKALPLDLIEAVVLARLADNQARASRRPARARGAP